MLGGKAKALAARNSIEDAHAALQLEAAGYRVADAVGTDVLLWQKGGKVAYATPRLSDGKWHAQKLGGCLLFGSGHSVIAETPCIAFLNLLDMEPNKADEKQ